jgi:hypothetical protein
LLCHSVPSTSDCFNHFCGFSQSLAQAFDMNVNSSLFDVNMITPDFVKQGAAAVHSLWVMHEVVQKLEFGGANFNLLACEANPVSFGIKLQFTHFDDTYD